jgi:hypothetical protein
MQTQTVPPILLTRRTDLEYDVRLDLASLDEEQQRRWFYKRDYEPTEYVKDVMRMVPAGYQFSAYDHYKQLLTLQESK